MVCVFEVLPELYLKEQYQYPVYLAEDSEEIRSKYPKNDWLYYKENTHINNVSLTSDIFDALKFSTTRDSNSKALSRAFKTGRFVTIDINPIQIYYYYYKWGVFTQLKDKSIIQECIVPHVRMKKAGCTFALENDYNRDGLNRNRYLAWGITKSDANEGLVQLIDMIKQDIQISGNQQLIDSYKLLVQKKEVKYQFLELNFNILFN